MLTHNQVFILDLLISLMPYGTEFSTSRLYASIPDNKLDFDEVADICSSLESIDCISDLKIGTTGIVENLRLTYAGRNYEELQKLEHMERNKENLIGIKRGILYTIIGEAAILLLSALLKWLLQ